MVRRVPVSLELQMVGGDPAGLSSESTPLSTLPRTWSSPLGVGGRRSEVVSPGAEESKCEWRFNERRGPCHSSRVWTSGVGVSAGPAPFVVHEGAPAPFPAPSFWGPPAFLGPSACRSVTPSSAFLLRRHSPCVLVCAQRSLLFFEGHWSCQVRAHRPFHAQPDLTDLISIAVSVPPSQTWPHAEVPEVSTLTHAPAPQRQALASVSSSDAPGAGQTTEMKARVSVCWRWSAGSQRAGPAHACLGISSSWCCR